MKFALIEACVFSWLVVAPASANARAVDTPPVTALGSDPAPSGAGDEAAALAKKLANPIAALISVPLQNNVDWGGGPDGDGVQYKLNIQPVIPITLSSDWNLISRTILPVLAQKDIVPAPPGRSSSQFGLGDTLQSLWLSPQHPGKSGIIWGIGPALLLRTATDKVLGSGKWGAGPTVVVLKQTGRWTIGGLANHVWSVAGDSSRDKVSSSYVQPFLSYTTPQATTFTINSETTYDWIHHTWTVPVNLMVSQLLPPKKTGLSFPISIQGGYRHYFEAPEGGPSNGIRIAITALFPKK
jgi:hypothetical protein